MTIEDVSHSCFRNVVGKFTLHAVQNSQNQKSVLLGQLRESSVTYVILFPLAGHNL
jgi:hypothetical protein